ncbi:hypothetical protein [Paenibacillus psychroresistens]|nr:hypothetical protein [Paenibacillus psychroresistens]
MTNQNQDNSDSFNERLDQAAQIYRDAVAGDVTAVQEANRLFEQLRLENPAHPLVNAYYGGTMLLIARDKTKPLEKLKWSKNGLKLLDKAVAAAPEDSLIRLLRGKAVFKLPEKHFRRTQTVIEDYTFLIDQEMRQEGTLEPEKYSQVVYDLGEAYHRIGRNKDAEMCWKRLENQTQDPEMQQLLSTNLQSLEGKPEIEDNKTESLSSMLVGAALAIGNAFSRWVEKEKKKEKAALRRKRRKNKKSRR